jgi:hypothetical protein
MRVLVVGSVVALALALPAVAQARTVTGTVATSVLNVRLCPHTSCSVISQVLYGWKITIFQECMSGTSIYGDRKWDRIYDGLLLGWVSDYYVAGTGYGPNAGVPQSCSGE